jgi:hypothetical protein
MAEESVVSKDEKAFDRFELAPALLLGLTALGAALASLQSGRWGGRPRASLVALVAALLLGCAGPEAGDPSASTTGEPGASTAVAETSSPPTGRAPRHHIVRHGRATDDRGDLKLVYGRLSDADHRQLEQAFREERFFEDVIDNLNASLVLPRDVEVRLQECGETDAFYDPESSSINLCYELFDHFLELFAGQAQGESDEEQQEVASKAVAALAFTFYHELGHALIDVYGLPATGREEDAVDQLATVMLLETWEGEDSELAILSSAEWFDLDAGESQEDDPSGAMADEHSLDEQRYYNLVCWIYGSDPDYFSDVADDWQLPEKRAERCPSEYAQMSGAWNTLLGPHMRDAG